MQCGYRTANDCLHCVGDAGAIWSVSDRFGFRADFDWFNADVGDLWTINLGVEYYFGGSPKADRSAAPPAEAAE